MDLIIDWADNEQFNSDGEMTPEIWSKTVELVEDAECGLDIDYIEDFVHDAREELSNE